MALVCSPYHRGSTQSSDMAWHWWLTSQNVKTKAVPVVDSSLQLNIFAQTLVWQTLLSFHHNAKHAHPYLFWSLSGQDGNQGSTLAFRPLCSVLPAARVLHVTLTSKKTEKANSLYSLSNRSSLVLTLRPGRTGSGAEDNAYFFFSSDLPNLCGNFY